MNIVYDMPHDEYLRVDALSQSGIIKFLKSPLHYQHYITSKERITTDAMRFGSMLHTAILEPDKFNIAYEPISGDGRTKEYKNAVLSIKESGKEPITNSEYETIQQMRTVLYQTKFAQLVSDSKKEVSIFWDEIIDNIKIPCKARIDIISKQNILADYKTTTDADEYSFSYSIKKYYYDLQSAWYLRGWEVVTNTKPLGFCFIAQEKVSPYAVGLYNIIDLKIQNMVIQKVLADLADCIKNNSFPSYPDKIIDLDIKR